MPRKKQVEDIVPTPPPVDPDHIDGSERFSNNTGLQQEFIVCNSSGAPVRSYILNLHGEKAEELANQYANKIGGSVQ
jgi:hypothetical protein